MATIIDGHGSGPLHAVVSQMWSPLLTEPGVRVVLGGTSPGWTAVETYWVVPDARRARLLLPGSEPRHAAAALRAYQGLRPPRTRLFRAVVGLAVGLGVPAGRDRITLEVLDGSSVPTTPLAVAASVLGHPGAGAAVGVREGANAKATLQLFAPQPVGFVKLAWEAQSAHFVEVETEVLRRLAGSAGPVRVPAVLAAGLWGAQPYLVTEPLPPEVRRPGRAEGPTPAELLAIAPFVRDDVPIGTAHLQGVSARLRAAIDPVSSDLVSAAVALLDRVAMIDAPGPVVERWHGDLVPWNVARDGAGVLWVWDWETAEADAVLGLDAVHWALHTPTRPAPVEMADVLTSRIPGLRATVAAMGADERAADVAVAVYVLAMIDRGIALAAARGGWARVRLGPDALLRLVAAADRVI